MTKAELQAFMAQFRLGVLCSISGSSPQGALVGIAVSPEIEIVFDTVKTSRKYRNLTENPACSFVVGWAGEQTVQYEGEAKELHRPELAHYQEIYFAFWPDGPAPMSWPGIVYFAVRPTWIRFSDFDRRPPFIQEFSFAR